MKKYRGGNGQMYLAQEKIFGQIHRCLLTTQFLTPKDHRFGQLTFSPNWKKFPHPDGNLDGYFKTLNDRGVNVIATLLNGFYEKYPLPLKALPKNAPGLSTDDMGSWSLYRNMCEQFALRYGHVKDDSKIDIADFGGYANGNNFGPQAKVSGLGTVWMMQILNEIFNTWVKPVEEGSMSGTQYAHVLHYVVDGIWSMDPQMAIMAQCTPGWNRDWWTEFFNTWTTHYGAFPNYNPETNTGIAISFNQYLVGGCGAFGKCLVKDPFVEIPRIGKEVNDFLKDRGAYAFITEHGCASERNSDLGYPDYPGLDKYQAQAKHIIDSTNLWLSFSNILGATFYQYTTDPNEPRFEHTGIIDKGTGTEKPSYHLVKAAFEQPIPNPDPPTPDPTNMLKVSLSPSPFPNAVALNGYNAATGAKLYIYWDGGGQAPFVFSPSGQKESQVPIEYKGGQPATFPDGTHTVSVKDATGAILGAATFTVGAVSPPPAEVPGKRFFLRDGKIHFEFDDGTTKTVTPD